MQNKKTQNFERKKRGLAFISRSSEKKLSLSLPFSLSLSLTLTMSTAGLPYGLSAMLKEGHRHYSGLEEAVYKNIDACKQLAAIVKTSMGPNGKLRKKKSNSFGVALRAKHECFWSFSCFWARRILR